MLPEEAELIAAWVEDLSLPSGSVCLNIGSSTHDFRTVMQPQVGALMNRLEALGLRIIHCDLKGAPGVDEAGDVLDPAFQARLRRYGADLLICSNLLEHLTDPQAFAAACGSLVKQDGFGLFTVPRSFPYHPDPIDTMFRPSPQELAALLPDWEVVKAESLKAEGFKLSGLATIRYAARIALPFYRPRAWWPQAHQLLWLFRPYVQSMVLVRKSAPA